MPTQEQIQKALITTGETLPDRALRRPEMLRMVGMCSTTQWREEKAGRFPHRRELTPGGTVIWLLSEVTEWLQSRRVIGA